MLDRLAIENGIADSLQSVFAFTVGVQSVQAEAVQKVLRGTISNASLQRQAQARIKRLANMAKRNNSAAFKRELQALIEADVDEQLALYAEAFKAGIIRATPAVPRSVAVQNVIAVGTVQGFVNATVDRISSYAGRKVADVLEMAIDDKLKGEPLDKIARAASKLILEEGVKIKLPSGRNIHDVYAYVRTNVVTAVAHNSAEQQKAVYDSLDMDDEERGVETSSHWGARPEHAEWQGRVFQTWEEFVRVTGYGEITGICGINCRHIWYPFIPGVSVQRFFPKPKEENDRRYKAQQERRRMESEVRKLTAEDSVFKELGLGEPNKARLKMLRNRLKLHNEYQRNMAVMYANAA